MTGYGRGVAEHEGRRAVVEVRSVNHRFLDLKMRSSALEPALEEEIRAAVRSGCTRGAVTVTVRLERHGPGAAVRLDLDAARRVYSDLNDLARALSMDGPVSLDLVCAQPGVLVSRDEDTDSEATSTCVKQALAGAMDNFLRMREVEGRALAEDLQARLSRVGELAAEIDTLAAAAPEEARRRFADRLARLLDKVELDPARLAQEVAILADRLDVTEELVRLRSHITHLGDMMREAAESGAPVGRRLDFLVQELGRELNTVGSKSQSAAIARLVVEAKAEVEKIREQVQNIE